MTLIDFCSLYYQINIKNIFVNKMIQQGENMKERMGVTLKVDSPNRDEELKVIKSEDNESTMVEG